MSPTALKRAAMALVILVVLWGVAALLRGSASDEIASLALPQLTAADVDRIVIERRADTVDLVKDGATWQVNGWEASQTNVDELFTALGEVNDGSELVARSPSSHARMGVDAASGRRFRFMRDDDTLADFTVGDRTGRGRGGAGFVRPAGEDNVYRSAARLPRLADRGVAGWRERRIAALAVETVTLVDVVRTDGAYALARSDSGQWTVDGAAADSMAVMRVVGAFRDLQAAGFPTPEQERDSVDVSDPYRRITLRTGPADTLLSLVFDSTETGAWVQRTSGGPVYRLDRWRIDALMPADSTLRARETTRSGS